MDNELEALAVRTAELFNSPSTKGLTIKLTFGTIKSVGENHSTALVDLGNAEIRALNKSGDKLIVGESVVIGYISSLADAVIWYRTGLSIPQSGGVS